MPQNTHLGFISAESERLHDPGHTGHDLERLRDDAEKTAQNLVWVPDSSVSRIFAKRCAALNHDLKPTLAALELSAPAPPVSDDFRWLFDNGRLLSAELRNVTEVLSREKRSPHVRTVDRLVVPRVMALAEAYLEAVSYEFVEQEFVLFVETFQKTTVLELRELWGLVSALKLVLLEQVGRHSAPLLRRPQEDGQKVGVCIRSLREIGQVTWKHPLEGLGVVHQILREDPVGIYEKMDFDSRDFYRNKLSNIAKHSDCTESDVAQEARTLAREASRRTYSDPRILERKSHVGYYLAGKGRATLQRKVSFRAPIGQRFQEFVRRHPDELFLGGIAAIVLAILTRALILITGPSTSFWMAAFFALLLLLPCSQSAVQLMNYLVTSLLPAEILPKLDFSDAVPGDCVTLVVIPSLLLNEPQVRALVEKLEVHFLGNHDPNIHFALLTDLPDSREPAREDSALISLCSSLIQELNEKHARQNMGSFLMLHRHRAYNPREMRWMGWERKRGKLLDLNKLLRGKYDSFPVKVGDLSILRRVRFVITLDSDTELPRGTAQRMIGAIAHPLNQAVIDPERNIVVEGYGILQPRVGVSVQSTSHSRLAAIHAGETGLDIYTRAVSDAYQDLFGEGSFAGKGIYEVDTVHRVLDRRFPRNTLLSHDLIEGAYARAGLASDIEVIEDYPSHYSAYNRRKHRWLRGDWQIVSWLLPHVFEESAKPVPNPISLISWWKILDNLRRSLVEPATFVLLVLGWFLPHASPWLWTLCTIGILFVPAAFEFAIRLLKALFQANFTIARDAVDTFYAASMNLFFNLIFLAHQTMLCLDAVGRALVRRFFTHHRLLEWETAAEVEMGRRANTPVDAYLDWTSALALSLALLVWAIRPLALYAALPVLFLWAGSKAVSRWMSQSPRPARNRASRKDVRFLRRTALETWRYFAEFSTEEHNWLVPDNVQEQPAAVAARVSPTNLGFLLNARQAAVEFGYLTVPEFAEQTLRTLRTVGSLEKYRGHLLNWYDTRTLAPLPPRFVSSVDSGNLLASLWTLQQGALDRLKLPPLQPCLVQGFLDHLRLLAARHAIPWRVVSACEREQNTDRWLQSVASLQDSLFEQAPETAARSKRAAKAKWLVEETRLRLRNLQTTLSDYVPWLAPEFAELRCDNSLNLPLMDSIPLELLPEFMTDLTERVGWALRSARNLDVFLYQHFWESLRVADMNLRRLIADLQRVAAESGRLADEMEFEFLFNRRRKLLSVGLNVETREVHTACYDLLGTESRTAVFVAIAKEDIPQDSWFLLGRGHTLDAGRPVLLSWTGTLFEYLMPSLWMRSYSNTLLDRSRVAAVRSQQRYAARKGVPWGISESAYCKLDEQGSYQYYAFGLPHLALRKPEVERLVVSPYSTFLALEVDPAGALRNLHAMVDMGWEGNYGFYEAADFSPRRRWPWQSRYRLVRCWMAHHQGMTLLALCNFLNGNVVQKWFHSERRVQATELLLHEKPVAHVRRKDIPRSAAAA